MPTYPRSQALLVMFAVCRELPVCMETSRKLHRTIEHLQSDQYLYMNLVIQHVNIIHHNYVLYLFMLYNS